MSDPSPIFSEQPVPPRSLDRDSHLRISKKRTESRNRMYSEEDIRAGWPPITTMKGWPDLQHYDPDHNAPEGLQRIQNPPNIFN